MLGLVRASQNTACLSTTTAPQQTVKAPQHHDGRTTEPRRRRAVDRTRGDIPADGRCVTLLRYGACARHRVAGAQALAAGGGGGAHRCATRGRHARGTRFRTAHRVPPASARLGEQPRCTLPHTDTRPRACVHTGAGAASRPFGGWPEPVRKR